MTAVLERLEARIKRLKQEPLGFNNKLDDECRLLELAADRIRELELVHGSIGETYLDKARLLYDQTN